jgi:cbb3-type cytochrome oxidase cytochrome c subunit
MAAHPNPRLSSEAYRQELVRDGQRRFAEWHEAYQKHCQQYRSVQLKSPSLPVAPVSSEAYRQELARDGQRRFAEWHQNFLDYQRQFLTEISQ